MVNFFIKNITATLSFVLKLSVAASKLNILQEKLKPIVQQYVKNWEEIVKS